MNIPICSSLIFLIALLIHLPQKVSQLVSSYGSLSEVLKFIVFSHSHENINQMNFLFYIIACCLFTFYSSELMSQKVGNFGSSIEKKIGPKKIRVPYPDVISYLGHVEPGSEDAFVGNKKYTYLYLWIQAVAPEIGIRMISPVDYKKIRTLLRF